MLKLNSSIRTLKAFFVNKGELGIVNLNQDFELSTKIALRVGKTYQQRKESLEVSSMCDRRIIKSWFKSLLQKEPSTS